MKTTIRCFSIGAVIAFFGILTIMNLHAQQPRQQQGFTYQAVARNLSGMPMADQKLTVKIGIHAKSGEGELIWGEEHDVQTSPLGLFSLTVGDPDAMNPSGSAGSFDQIDWSAYSYFLKVWVKTDGEFMDMGGSPIQTVPMAQHATSASSATSNFSIQPNQDGLPGEALFEVKRADGQPVFAVYEDMVWVYVDTTAVKGVKGGFAVGGYSRNKGVTQEYMRVTPDSVRVYIDSDAQAKGVKGGFAVGGYSRNAKGSADDLLVVQPSSTHVFFDEDAAAKGVKGGFAVGGYSRSKSASNQLMSLTPLNYFIGHEAGMSIANDGLYNQIIGYQAGRLTSSADYNIFLGYQAGMNNTTGGSNILLGYRAGLNFNGTNNVIIGTAACENSQMFNSVVIGTEAAKNAQGDGWGNVVVGHKAGYNNKKSGGTGISGARNVFVGRQAGEENDVGGANVYVGSFAGNGKIESYRNVCVGDDAGGVGSEGSSNVYVGYRAGYTNRGDYNIIIGREAGSAETNYTLDSDFDNNVLIGYRSGFNNKTGSGNMFLGSYSGYYEEGSDKLYIDNSNTSSPLIWGDFSNDYVKINHYLGVGTAPSNVHGLRVDGGSDASYSMVVFKGAYAYGNGFVSASDRTLKKEIATLEHALDKVISLRGVSYTWDTDNPDVGCSDESLQIGIIAQEVEGVFPELVTQNADGYKGVSYGKFSAVLIEAIKEQQLMIDQQQRIIEDLEERLRLLELSGLSQSASR